MLGVSSNIISRPLTTGGYHSRWRRGGRRAPQTRVRAARARHSRPQNTHTRHRTEQAGSVHSQTCTGQAQPPKALRTRTRGIAQSRQLRTRNAFLPEYLLPVPMAYPPPYTQRAVPFSPGSSCPSPPLGCFSLSLLQPARLLSAHAISSSCRVMLPHCHVTLASP